MKKHFRMRARITSVSLVIMLLFAPLMSYAATSDDLSETKDKINSLEEQQKENESEIDSLEEEQNTLQGRISSYNSKLQSLIESSDAVLADISENEKQIEKTQKNIEQTKSDIIDMENTLQEKKDDMASRIRFIYENESNSFLAVLLSADGFADFLNKLEYISEINSYDRDKMDEYKTALEELSDKKEQLAEQEDALEDKNASLKALKEEYEEKQTQVASLIEQTKSALNDTQSDLSDANDKQSDIEAQLASMKEYEKELEDKLAKEEASKQSEISKDEEEIESGARVSASASDRELLETIVYCEARGSTYACQVAVASVVINRVKSSKFPNSISGVIYQKGQFSPVASGTFAYYLSHKKNDGYASCKKAVSKVLSDGSQNKFLFFRSKESADAAGISGTQIGSEVFF